MYKLFILLALVAGVWTAPRPSALETEHVQIIATAPIASSYQNIHKVTIEDSDPAPDFEPEDDSEIEDETIYVADSVAATTAKMEGESTIKAKPAEGDKKVVNTKTGGTKSIVTEPVAAETVNDKKSTDESDLIHTASIYTPEDAPHISSSYSKVYRKIDKTPEIVIHAPVVTHAHVFADAPVNVGAPVFAYAAHATPFYVDYW